jgi:hypothetical protein
MKNMRAAQRAADAPVKESKRGKKTRTR